jgi:PAS domain S-box-containing protein
MLAADLAGEVPGGLLLVAGVGVCGLSLALTWTRAVRAQNRRLLDAINNMSQGLNMFDAQGRIRLVNRRYLDMYKLSPNVVKAGCSLRQLIEHRKETGLFVDDVDAYCQRILDSMKGGTSAPHYVQASDGRIVLAKNEPLYGGGWVSTHEDITERRQAEEERAAIREQEHRRSAIESAIAAFRPIAGRLLDSVGASASAMRKRPFRFLRADDDARGKRRARLQRSVDQRRRRGNCRRRTVAFDRRDQPAIDADRHHRGARNR